MTASEKFTTAHRIAKQLGSEFGHYSVRLSFALRNLDYSINSNVFDGEDEGDAYTVTVSDVQDDPTSNGTFKQVLVKLEICGDVEEYSYTHGYSSNIEKWMSDHLGFQNEFISNYIISQF